MSVKYRSVQYNLGHVLLCPPCLIRIACSTYKRVVLRSSGAFRSEQVKEIHPKAPVAGRPPPPPPPAGRNKKK
jgi:hypothetical protein